MDAETGISSVPTTWKDIIGHEMKQPYFIKMWAFLREQYRKDDPPVYPLKHQIFNAFKYVPFERVKVVIVGQDPYHTPGMAHGLAFSVLPGFTLPPSLRNIFRELETDLNVTGINQHGCLVDWARQGVLLLNTILTVEQGSPLSHKDIGWESFTAFVLSHLGEFRKHKIVFIGWGKNAREVIDGRVSWCGGHYHQAFYSPHPSPYSADRGFFGSKPFSKTNIALEENGLTPIDWTRGLLIGPKDVEL